MAKPPVPKRYAASGKHRKGKKVRTNLRPLLERKLLYDGLVMLSPTLIERYNRALVTIGLTPTLQKKIHIDGIGWSPEVAREKKDSFYLCAGGLINPTAIIVTPEQYKKPVYFPVFSWMRRLMRQVFDKYHREIFDITSTTPITFDLEDFMTALTSPTDLLLFSEIIAVPHTEHLAEFAVEQQQLVAQFMEGLNCLDTKLRDSLRGHREAHGDLRSRRLDMRSLSFDLFNDFYTVAFGGVSVIRGVGGKDMLILEDENEFKQLVSSGLQIRANVHYLFDVDCTAFRALYEAGMLCIPTERFRALPQLLGDKKDMLLAFALCDCSSDINWDSLSTAKKKSLIQAHPDKIPMMFGELERYAAELRRSDRELELSEELWLFLLEPSDKLPPDTQEVLASLLAKREPRNLLSLYTHDKNYFLRLYEEWSAQKQTWVANYIAARYIPRMKQP